MAMGMSMKSKFAVATKIVAADGSGDFDDIQSAIDDLPAGGGVVWIKEGTYNITSPISILTNNVTLAGSGRGTILFLPNDENQDIINIGNNSTTLEGIIIKDLQINGNNANQTILSSNGIFFRGGSSNKITKSGILNCYIHHCSNYGISLKQDENNIITGNQITNNYVGIKMYESDSDTISGNQINDNSMNHGPLGDLGYGIICQNSDLNIVSGNQVNDNKNDGIRLYNSDYNIISNNKLDGNDYGINIAVNTCDKNMILGNISLNNITSNLSDLGTNTQISHNLTS